MEPTNIVQKKIEKLTKLINHHNYRYYVLDSPEISDAEYDELIQDIQRLEEEHPELITPDSPTQRVGAPPVEVFGVVEHPQPLLSLANAFSYEGIAVWYKRISNLLGERYVDFVCEPKIDGLAVALTYIDGMLVTGATRGDGYRGENITQNLRTVKSIPLSVPEEAPPRFEVRGEVYLPKEGFKKLNEERTKGGLPLFANPRNAAAGSVRQLDSSITARRPLDIFIYGLGWAEEKTVPDTHWEIMQWLKSLGFKINPNITLCHTIEEAEEYHQSWMEIRESWPYEADGMVVKVNTITLQQELGIVAHEPRWAIAYKFPAIQGTTRLIDIGINVGRTGSLNPYAVLEPVRVGGVVISSAALHNEEYIHHKDIRIGDWVILQRAGEVIPEIVKPVEDLRNGSERAFSMKGKAWEIYKKRRGIGEEIQPPDYVICPVCGAEVIKPEDEAMHRCTNAACPAQALEKIKHFVSRAAMDIDGVGEQLCQALFDDGLVKDAADLYYLNKEQLLNMERMADKSISKVLSSIERSKNRPLARVIFALGIFHVGEEYAALLADNFHNIDDLAKASGVELLSIPSIGPKIADSIVEFFRQEGNKRIIEKLEKAGVRLKSKEAAKPEVLPLDGLEFVITGRLESFTRLEAEARIKTLGGKATSDVSGKTSYLVAGADSGLKLTRAQRLGVKIISEAELLQRLNQANEFLLRKSDKLLLGNHLDHS